MFYNPVEMYDNCYKVDVEVDASCSIGLYLINSSRCSPRDKTHKEFLGYKKMCVV